MYRQVVSTMGSQTAANLVLVGLPSEEQESLPNSSMTIQLHLNEPDRWLGKGSTGRDGLLSMAPIRPVKTGMFRDLAKPRGFLSEDIPTPTHRHTLEFQHMAENPTNGGKSDTRSARLNPQYVVTSSSHFGDPRSLSPHVPGASPKSVAGVKKHTAPCNNNNARGLRVRRNGTWEGDGGDAHGLGDSTERSADGLSEGRRSTARGGDCKDSLEVYFYHHTRAEWRKAAALASGGGDNCGRLCISCMLHVLPFNVKIWPYSSCLCHGRNKATLHGFGAYEQGVDHVKKLSYWKYDPITMRIAIRELERVGFHKCVTVSGFREPLSEHKFQFSSACSQQCPKR
ncbi:hypothetical protein K438DRAFT_1767774 [Mycena galopus ATCC 62051]|nr:hypothetical protein K438DRAFT_1767774 [Mycena galopus ATCC 62051]